MYLFIDTSTRTGSVGLWQPDAQTFVRVLAWTSRQNHTAELMPAVDAVLRGAGVSPSDIEGIGVTYGPGGFGALRAGLGVAKGLAFALSVPIVGVSTLEATAYPYRLAGWPVCPVLDAGRDLVGWARFQWTNNGWQRRQPDRVTSVEDLLAASKRHTLFCGEGAATHARRLTEAMGQRAHLIVEPMPLSRLQGLAELASARLRAGERDPVAGLQPRYLRPPGITKPNPPQRVRYGTPAPAGM